MNFSLILKGIRFILSTIALICCLIGAALNGYAQSAISDSIPVIIPSPSDTTGLYANPDSTYKVLTARRDSIPADSVRIDGDTVSVPQDSSIETTIFYSCRDSMRMSVAEQKVYLYGNAKVTYGDRILESEFMEINWATNEVKAYGLVDSLTGKTTGKPVFHEGPDMYVADVIRYNMKSGKGIITGIVTKQGDGYIHGGPVKKTPEAIYVKHAMYTTCDMGHPHFGIIASKLKVIPNDKVVTGPFHMEIMGIPLPLGLPLGFFPVTKRSKSGIIMPTIGEQRTRGFFLSQGGYYWAVSDYVGVKMLGDVYANKSYRLTGTSTYTKRYSYNGNVALNYASLREGFDDYDSVPAAKSYSIFWTHNTISNKSSRFTAQVNISSPSYYRSTSYNPNNYQSTSFMSTVSWNKTFKNSPFSMNISGRQSQNTLTKIMDVTLPDASFMMNRIYPFKARGSSGNKWFEKINIAYSGNTKYQFTNNLGNTSLRDTLEINKETFPVILENGQWGATHTIPVTTTLKVFKYLSVNPSFNYQEFWYDRKLSYQYNASTKLVDIDTVRGFARTNSYNTAVALTTRIYGTYRLKNAVLKAIRHTLIPTVSYSYRPDFSEEKYGNYATYQDSTGRMYKSSVYTTGGPGSGTQNLISFTLQNTLEGKVRNRKDTTGENALKRVKLLENLSLSGGYNFTADSLQWSVIALNARSRFFDKIDFNFTSTLDPYVNVLMGNPLNTYRSYVRINTLNLTENGTPLNLINYNLSLSTNLNPKGARAQQPSIIPNPSTPTFGNGTPYIDFSIPWNLNIMYNLIYNKLAVTGAPYTQSIRFTGDVKITDHWKIGFDTGYDFVNNGISSTMLMITRDLHCWQMSMNARITGAYPGYFFTINAKSSMLRDLKATKRNPNNVSNGY